MILVTFLKSLQILFNVMNDSNFKTDHAFCLGVSTLSRCSKYSVATVTPIKRRKVNKRDSQ